MADKGELLSDGVMVYRVRRQKRIGWAITAAALAALASTPLLSSDGAIVLTILGGLPGLLIGLLTAATAGRDPGGARGGNPGVVSLHDGWLEVTYGGKEKMFDAEEVEGGWIEEGAGHQVAVVRLKDGTLVAARFDSGRRSEAEELLRAVGADAKAVAMKLSASSLGGRGCATSCLFVAFLFGLPFPILLLVGLYLLLTGDAAGWDMTGYASFATFIVAIGTWLSVRALSSTTVMIGNDGLWLKRTLWRRRFVPFEQLDDMWRAEKSVWLTTGSSRIRLRCVNGLAAEALIDRVERARDAREEAAGAADLDELDRAGRSLREWRQHLTQLLERGSRYRTRALQRDDVLRVAEDPAASPERRVGAAFALAACADDAERKRLRIAAESCAHRPLRIALQSATEGEIEAEAVEQAMRGADVAAR